MYNNETNDRNIPIIIPVLIIIAFVIIVNVVIYVSLNIRLSDFENRENTVEESYTDEVVKEDFSMSAKSITSEQLQGLAFGNPDYIYYISDIEVSGVEYNTNILNTNIGYVITANGNTLYVRPGDTIDVRCKIGNSPEYGYYIRDAKVYVVRFGDKTLYINQNE